MQSLASIELSRLRFAVTGVGGGVGVTTIAALIAVALSDKTGLPPKVVDHSGGTIVKLVADASPSADHWVYDLGPHATTTTQQLATGILGHPIVVCSTAPESIASALVVLKQLSSVKQDMVASSPDVPIPPAIIVINSTSHRKSATRAAARLQRTVPGAPVIALPWDPTLAMPGEIELSRLADPTLEAANWLLGS